MPTREDAGNDKVVDESQESYVLPADDPPAQQKPAQQKPRSTSRKRTKGDAANAGVKKRGRPKKVAQPDKPLKGNTATKKNASSKKNAADPPEEDGDASSSESVKSPAKKKQRDLNEDNSIENLSVSGNSEEDNVENMPGKTTLSEHETQIITNVAAASVENNQSSTQPAAMEETNAAAVNQQSSTEENAQQPEAPEETNAAEHVPDVEDKEKRIEFAVPETLK